MQRIAVARDRAFNFAYRENLDRLAQMGQVLFFSPLAGDELPKDVDLVYLPGGYPELFAPQLALNRMLASQLVQYAEAGGRILAECGGMMYLGKSLTDQDGKVWPMAGVLPIECTMQGARLHLGVFSENHLSGRKVIEIVHERSSFTTNIFTETLQYYSYHSTSDKDRKVCRTRHDAYGTGENTSLRIKCKQL